MPAGVPGAPAGTSANAWLRPQTSLGRLARLAERLHGQYRMVYAQNRQNGYDCWWIAADEQLKHHARCFGLLSPQGGWWTIPMWREATMFWLTARAAALGGFDCAEEICEFLNNWRTAQVTHIVIVAALSVMSDALCVNLWQEGLCTIGDSALALAVSLGQDYQPTAWLTTIFVTLGYDMDKHFVALIATVVEDTGAAEATGAEARKAEAARAEAAREVAARGPAALARH